MRNARHPRSTPIISALVIGLTISACGTVSTESFRVVNSPNVDSAVIATDADFSRYDRLMAADAGIYFPNDAAPSSADQQMLRQKMRDAFIGQLAHYQFSQESGPSTMLIQASLIDLRNANTVDAAAIRSDLRDIATPGSLVFLMELKDSVSDKVLARAADSRYAPAIAVSDDGATDWAAVDAAAERWAELFRKFLDENIEH